MRRSYTSVTYYHSERYGWSHYPWRLLVNAISPSEQPSECYWWIPNWILEDETNGELT